MGNYANFYNSVNGDRLYDAESFTEWLAPFFTNGVFNGQLQVLQGSNMHIQVSTGYCHINGKTRYFDVITDLTIETANSVLNRIDSVVLRRNDTERNITIEIIKGVESSEPVATDPVRENGIYDLVLARIYVKAATTAITQADITDMRLDRNMCGYVVGTVNEIDFNQIAVQWESWKQQYSETQVADFETWFNTIKGQISSDLGTQLNSQMTRDVKNAPFTIGKDTFVEDTTYSQYPFRAVFENLEISADDVAEIILHPSSIELGVIAPICNTFENGLYIYSDSVPTEDIVLTRISLRKENLV